MESAHFNFKGFSFDTLLFPIHIASVFSVFVYRPEILQKSSNSLRNAPTDSISLRNAVVLSADGSHFISTLFTIIPLIS